MSSEVDDGTILFRVLRELSDEETAASYTDVCEEGDKFAGTEDRFRISLLIVIVSS